MGWPHQAPESPLTVCVSFQLLAHPSSSGISHPADRRDQDTPRPPGPSSPSSGLPALRDQPLRPPRVPGRRADTVSQGVPNAHGTHSVCSSPRLGWPDPRSSRASRVLSITGLTKISKTIMDNIILKNPVEGLPWWLSGTESTCQSRRHGSIPDLRRSHLPRSD